MKIPLDDQIAEIERELGMRRRVYPHMVAKGTYDQGQADRQVARLEAVLATLTWLKANRQAVIDDRL